MKTYTANINPTTAEYLREQIAMIESNLPTWEKWGWTELVEEESVNMELYKALLDILSDS